MVTAEHMGPDIQFRFRFTVFPFRLPPLHVRTSKGGERLRVSVATCTHYIMQLTLKYCAVLCTVDFFNKSLRVVLLGSI